MARSAKMSGYVLPAESAGGFYAHTFPGFPGAWSPGSPLSLQHLGLEEAEADAMIEAMGLPLQKVEMGHAEATAPLDYGDNHAPSEEAAPAAPAEEEAPLSTEEESG